MDLDLKACSPEVAAILALDGNGTRPMPLVCQASPSSAAQAMQQLRGRTASQLFPASPHPQGALAGLWVYFSCFDAAHEIAQADSSSEGSYWHAILHRQEPDDFNSGYWFRRVDKRCRVYAALASAASEIAERYPAGGLKVSATVWDPHAFIDYCATARANPGSVQEQVALEVQLAEWQLLFQHCAGTSI